MRISIIDKTLFFVRIYIFIYKTEIMRYCFYIREIKLVEDRKHYYNKMTERILSMSNKEKIVQLLDIVPDYKMGYVLAYVQGITAYEEADDIFCQKMIEDYENDTDPEKDNEYTLEECKKEWGLA